MRLRICHLYGNLLNTYGDNGNLLMLQYCARERRSFSNRTISLDQPFDPNKYDLVFFGGGQDYEQFIVSKDIQAKAAGIKVHRKRWRSVGHLWRLPIIGTLLHGLRPAQKYPASARSTTAVPERDNNRFIG